MISRRDFLRAGTVAGLFTALPGGAAATGQTEQSAPLFEAICDTHCNEGDVFLATINQTAYRTHGIDTDPGSVIPLIAEALRQNHPVVGLTSDAVLLLAEQIATAEGYKLSFKGVHKHTGEHNLQHHLKLDRHWHKDTESALQQSRQQWPEIIAKLIPALVGRSVPSELKTVSVASKRATTSPGHLVSWILEPA